MAGQGAGMLRTLLVFTLPFTTLLAGLPSVEGNTFQGAPSQLNLAEIPIEKNAEKQTANALAKLHD